MTKKNNDRSLFLYTALIFIVAILLIIISFFSQKNLEKQHEEYVGEQTAANSISEKASQLSEENMILLETTKSLNEKNNDLTSENEQLILEKDTLQKKYDNDELMIKIFNDIDEKKFSQAEKDFELLDISDLNEEQQQFYEYLKELLQKNYKKRAK